MNNVPIPQDLPLLVGKTQSLNDLILRINSINNPNEAQLRDIFCELSNHVKIKVWFDCPVAVRVKKYKVENVTEYVFGKFFNGTTGFGYSVRHKNVRSGHHFNVISHVIRYEPVIERQPRDEGFKSLEQFARKFDLRFISFDLIKSLYESTSGQHGGKYMPSDFRKLGPRGKEVLNRFLKGFVSLDVAGPYYHERTDTSTGKIYKYYSEHHSSYSASGRDITISHTCGLDRISYASEYPGCGNGRYGILANENEFLHLEDD